MENQCIFSRETTNEIKYIPFFARLSYQVLVPLSRGFRLVRLAEGLRCDGVVEATELPIGFPNISRSCAISRKLKSLFEPAARFLSEK